MRNLSFAALALVIFQGVLGGMRVLFDERTLAMLHGCTGPLFFAVTVAMVVFTSKSWALREPRFAERRPATSSLVRWLAVVTCVLVYLQLVFGAVLRHVPVDSEPGAFMLAVRFHLFLAGVLTLHVLLFAWLVLGIFAACDRSTGLVLALCGLIACNCSWARAPGSSSLPCRLGRAAWLPFAPFAIQADGWLQTHIITAHVAIGSLTVGDVAVRWRFTAWRSLPANSLSATRISTSNMGVAT